MRLKIACIFNEIRNGKKFVIKMIKYVKILPAGVLKLLRYSRKFVIAVFVIYINFL